MAGNDTLLSNCSAENVNLFIINRVFGATGAVCCFISCLILLLIVCSKAYRTVPQRLFLYLMVAIVLRELFIAAALEQHKMYTYPKKDRACMWIGFLWNRTGILVFVFTVGIKIYLFYRVKYYVARGNIAPRFLQSRHRRVILEGLYVVLPTLVSLVCSCIPFITGNYGLAGAWCWIRALDHNMYNCTLDTAGLFEQVFVGYIFYISGSVIGFILLVVVYRRLSRTTKENRLFLRKTVYVIITFLVNIIMMIFALIVRITAAKKQEYRHPTIWFLFAVTFPRSLLLFPIVYLICFSLNDLVKTFKSRFYPRISLVQAANEQEWLQDKYTSETSPVLHEHSNALDYGSTTQQTEVDISL